MVPTESYAHPVVRLNEAAPDSTGTQGTLRKICTQQTEIRGDGGSSLADPVLQVAVSAVVKNPWIGLGTDSELIVSPRHTAARLARMLSDRILAVVGGADAVVAFGKGAIVGEAGEIEHGAAMTHTPYFASNLRSFFDGSAVISFADTRGPAGETLVVPLCEKRTGTVRDYYQSVRVRLADAPLADEIVLVAAAATGPRPFPRVGDRSTDPPLDTSHMNGALA